MLDPKDQYKQKIMEALEKFPVSSDEMAKIEDYIMGDSDNSFLETLSFVDMMSLSHNITGGISVLLNDLSKKGRIEDANKVVEVVFAMGKATSYQACNVGIYNMDNKGIDVLTPDKKAALQAMEIGMGMQYCNISDHRFKSLAKMAENNPENLRKAMDYHTITNFQNKNANGLLMLLATYFYVKYPDVNIFFDDRDKDLMKRYEDIVVNSMANIFENRMATAVIDEITNAVDRNQLNERILGLARNNNGVSKVLLRLVGATCFMNYALSDRLKNMVSVCLAANTNDMLEIMDYVDIRHNLRDSGGEFDRIFGMDAIKLIRWAAEKRKNTILRGQFRNNRDLFMMYVEKANFETYNFMMDIVKSIDVNLYNSKMANDKGQIQNKVIDAFVNLAEGTDAKMKQDIKAYLTGETEIDSLYPIRDELSSRSRYYYGDREYRALMSYVKVHGRDEMTARCETYMMLWMGSFFRNYLQYNGAKENRIEIVRIFENADAHKLALKYQACAVEGVVDALYSDNMKQEFTNVAKEVFEKYLESRKEELVQAFLDAESYSRYFGLLVLSSDVDANHADILKFSQDTAKIVKEQLLEILYEQKNWEDDVLKLLASKKAGERELAIRTLVKWDEEKYLPMLVEALEKEKNGKVRALLETVVKAEGGESSGGKTISQEDLVKELHKGGKKRTIAWAYETPFSKVYRMDGEEATEEYLQAVLLCYQAMGTGGVSPSAASLAEALDTASFAVYVNELFDKWLEAGAEAKKKWVLYAASIHGGDDIVKKLYHQIQEWPQIARGAIAAEAVQALALNPQPQALLIVDGISRKFKFKQVKAAAGKALEFAATQLGITTEELADRIVPDLGFDENMQRIFDYGERKFTVTITTALEIEVFDESGKKLKNLPAPGKKDDELKAAAAYDEFKQMKKQMKTTISSQKMRLEMALSTERLWSIQAWKDLFVKNPVMHQFAIGLIWGIYEERKLVQSFRYMEDGSFNTEDEDEFTLPESGTIGLVHPIELSEESRATWKEQLEDYEIVQPIEQLSREVFYRTAEEESQKSMERFGGYILNDLSLAGKLTALGWYRGSVQDAGGFYTYFREDVELGIGVELHFSGSYVGGLNEEVTVYDARFYKAGTITRGSYVYDEADEQKSYALKDVPERYFSEIVLQIKKATASSTEKNENWKESR